MSAGGKSTTFVPGEVVRVEIGRAEVKQGGDLGQLVLVVSGVQLAALPVDVEGVHVERIAPVAWPPVAGDLWRDYDGGLWFAHLYEHHGTYPRTELRLIPATSGASSYFKPDQFLTERGPVSLVHRDKADAEADGAER